MIKYYDNQTNAFTFLNLFTIKALKSFAIDEKISFFTSY